jgi:hypothetical protein
VRLNWLIPPRGNLQTAPATGIRIQTGTVGGIYGFFRYVALPVYFLMT